MKFHTFLTDSRVVWFCRSEGMIFQMNVTIPISFAEFETMEVYGPGQALKHFVNDCQSNME